MAEPTLFNNGYFALSTSTGSAVYTELADVKSFTVPLSRAELANSVMGDVAETFEPGLYSGQISARVRWSASIDALVFTRVNASSPFRLKFRAVDAAVSTNNPSYWFGKVKLFNAIPPSGDHGQLLEGELQFRLGSPTTAINRSTST